LNSTTVTLPMIFPAAGSCVWQHTASQDDSFHWRIPVTHRWSQCFWGITIQ